MKKIILMILLPLVISAKSPLGDITTENMTSGAKAEIYIPYVTNGLVLRYDAIENVGLGKKHDSAATVWKDIAGVYSNHDLSFEYGGFEDNCFVTGHTYAYNTRFNLLSQLNCPVTGARAPVSIEVSYIPPGDTAYRWTGVVPYGQQTLETWYSTSSLMACIYGSRIETAWHPPAGHITLTLSCDGSTLDYYCVHSGGTIRRIGSSVTRNNDSLGSRKLTFFCNSGCTVYAIRVYNRALSADEITHNYHADKKRFNLP